METFIFKGYDKVGQSLSHSLTKAGYTKVDSFADADIVLTYCITQDELEDVYFGSGGVIESAGAHTYCIDCSPSTPSFAKELASMATVNDMYPLDAPIFVRDITDEDPFAAPETISLLVGSEDKDFKAMTPILDCLSSHVINCGGQGSGQLTHNAFSLQQAAQVVSLIEAHALCKTTVKDAATDAIIDRSVSAQVTTPAARALHHAIIDHEFVGGYTTEIMMSELTAALKAADDSELILPQAEAAQQLLQLLCVIGGIDKTPAALSLVYGDEETCAQYGLDWSRAEETYGQHKHDESDDQDESAFPEDFSGYSSN
jgi:3-hydroxyisobutyrate dehydrogenase